MGAESGRAVLRVQELVTTFDCPGISSVSFAEQQIEHTLLISIYRLLLKTSNHSTRTEILFSLSGYADQKTVENKLL